MDKELLLKLGFSEKHIEHLKDYEKGVINVPNNNLSGKIITTYTCNSINIKNFKQNTFNILHINNR